MDLELSAAFPDVRVFLFGHLGDGNLHYNVLPAEANRSLPGEQAKRISDLVYQRVDSLGGSISAEHGLGQLKREENARFKSAIEVDIMRAVKTALDPLGIMNPGKLI
jgi:FAD/FMN-containing dehydrogenase